MNTRNAYRVLVLFGLLVAWGVGWRASASDYTARFTVATRLWAQQQYADALPQWQQLLADFPQAPFADLALLRVAQCAVADKQWEQATQALTTLRTHYPDSPYQADAAVLLYAIAMELNKLADADVLWTEVFTRWPDSPYTVQLIAIYFRSSNIAPAKSTENLRQILVLDWTQDALASIIYAPLVQAGRVEDAVAVHTQCQQLLNGDHKDDQAEMEDVAFRESLSKDAIEAMFVLFKQALDAHETATAQHWLTMMNTVAAAYPRTVEARKLYRTMQQASQK